MKLNVKRTATIGVAFMTIMMLWQVYNWYVPLFLNDFLENLFAGDKLIIGIIMALDNLFAIFMIPLMSNLSDKTKSRFGRRMPYVMVGITLSALSFALLPFVNDTGSIWLLIVNIFAVLVSMNIYRSPCVALMPDITPRALRSKGNSIINIMGGVGIAIGYTSVIFFSRSSNYVPFLLVAVVMFLALAFLIVFVKENRFVADYQRELAEHGLSTQEEAKEEELTGVAAQTNRRNVYLILLVVFFVYMANNAVETFMSIYSEVVFANATSLPLNMNPGALVILPFGLASFIFAVPAAFLADRVGRKFTVVIGASLMTATYLGLAILGFVDDFSLWLLAVFFMGGAGFSLIIVNIYPMVLENCAADTVGRYTGYYYTASMLAQSISPALAGLFMSGLVFGNVRVLFPYALLSMGAALVTLLFIRKGKNDLPQPTE